MSRPNGTAAYLPSSYANRWSGRLNRLPPIPDFTEDGTVTYSASGLPTGLSIDTDTGEITGTIDSYADLSSPYSVTITATNSAASVSTNVSFSWAVRQLVLRSPEDQANLIDATVSLERVCLASPGHSMRKSA